MGASGTGANCAPTLPQLHPLTIPVDEDPTLVEDTIQKKRGACLNPLEKRNINSPSSHNLKARVQARTSRVISQRHEQIQIGTLVLVATCKRAVEDSQPNPALDAERTTKSCQELPVGAKVLALPRLQAQPAWTGAPGANGPLGHGTAKRALVGAEIVGKLLERPHAAHHRPLCVRYKPK